MNQQTTTRQNKSFQDLVKEAKGRIQEINVQQLRQWQQEAKDFVLIDVREADAFSQGHIEGATHIPRGCLELEIEDVVPQRDKPIVMYCGGGSRSALSADTLQNMGYNNVYSLEGGWKAWKSS